MARDSVNSNQGTGMRLKLTITDAPQAQSGQAGGQTAQPPRELGGGHEFDACGGLIGRSGECDWILPCADKLVSRRHAAVTFEEGRFYLYDASLNGVRLNGAATPLGVGNKACLNHGDSIRIGHYVISAALLADTHPSAVQSLPVPLAASTAPVAGLGTIRDAFSAPAAAIPDDWDFAPGPLHGPPREMPALAVTRQFNNLQPAAMAAIREGLGLDPDTGGDGQPGAEALGAIARSARLSLCAMIALRKEFELVEQRCLGARARMTRRDHSALASHASAEAFFQAVMQAPDEAARERLLQGLGQDLRQIQGVHAGMIAALWKAFVCVVDECSPAKVRARLQSELNARGWRSWRRRLCLALAPNRSSWRFYQRWYVDQRKAGQTVFRSLFESAVERYMLSRRRQPRRPGGGVTPTHREGG